MKAKQRIRVFLLCAWCLLPVGIVNAEPVRVAVASNFKGPMVEIIRQYEQQTGQQVIPSFGSTGKQYAQIVHGAPFDAFFAADAIRPQRLAREGNALPNSRFTYAIGKLVLWSPRSNLVDSHGNVLLNGGFRHLAIANPKLAPYGQAAQETLQALGIWEASLPKLVRGENIAQTFQYVVSGNAELGFVAYSQVRQFEKTDRGSIWEVPATLYSPIEQQAVVLKDSPAIREFVSYIQSEQALKIIHAYGYDTPS